MADMAYIPPPFSVRVINKVIKMLRTFNFIQPKYQVLHEDQRTKSKGDICLRKSAKHTKGRRISSLEALPLTGLASRTTNVLIRTGDAHLPLSSV